jgi:hypothetical protein
MRLSVEASPKEGPLLWVFVVVVESKQSGKDFDRPRYQAMRLMIRESDFVCIDALDRLAEIMTVSLPSGNILLEWLEQTSLVSITKHYSTPGNLKQWAISEK